MPANTISIAGERHQGSTRKPPIAVIGLVVAGGRWGLGGRVQPSEGRRVLLKHANARIARKIAHNRIHPRQANVYGAPNEEGTARSRREDALLCQRPDRRSTEVELSHLRKVAQVPKGGVEVGVLLELCAVCEHLIQAEIPLYDRVDKALLRVDCIRIGYMTSF
jgi:hypothetical protein